MASYWGQSTSGDAPSDRHRACQAYYSRGSDRQSYIAGQNAWPYFYDQHGAGVHLAIS